MARRRHRRHPERRRPRRLVRRQSRPARLRTSTRQALRAQTGAGVTGEVVRFRDPDAATILAMGSAGRDESRVGGRGSRGGRPRSQDRCRHRVRRRPRHLNLFRFPAEHPEPAGPDGSPRSVVAAALIAGARVSQPGDCGRDGQERSRQRSLASNQRPATGLVRSWSRWPRPVIDSFDVMFLSFARQLTRNGVDRDE